MKRKKRKAKQKYQNCPVCGDKNRLVYKNVANRWKPYFVACSYCRFRSKPAFTVFGAKRNWNKATSIVSVTEVKGGNENA